MRELLIEYSYFEWRGALLENGELLELTIEAIPEDTLRPRDVFWARVVKLLPELRGAIVDLGVARGFLQPRQYPNCPVLRVNSASSATSSPSYVSCRLREGLELPVQIRKLPRAGKVAQVTSRIAVDGFYLSWHPGWPDTSWPWQASREVRQRVANTLQPHLRPQDGFSAHLRSTAASEAELLAEVDMLQHAWKHVVSRLQGRQDLGLAYRMEDPVSRIFVDIAPAMVDALYVDGPEFAVERARAAWSRMTYQRETPVIRHTQNQSLFVERQVDEQLQRALQPTCPLPQGGHLLFEPTEGATVVDVNSSALGIIRPAGSLSQLDQSLSDVNTLAAKTIATQVRLRGYAGSIVVDLVNSLRGRQRQNFARYLSLCLRDDPWVRAFHVHDKCTLVHIQREYRRPSLAEQLLDPCPHCGSRNHSLTPRAQARDLLRQTIQKLRLAPQAHKVVAEAPAQVVTHLQQNEPYLLREFRQQTGVLLDLRVSPQTAVHIRFVEAG